MSSWIRSDFYFDMPWVTFRINVRSIVGQSLHGILKEYKNDPEVLGQFITSLIEYRRPTLKGCVVVSIELRVPAGVFEVQVIHPSLPKTKGGMVPQHFRLEPCPVCGLDMPTDGMIWTKMVEDSPNARLPYVIEVCSEACLNK